MAQLAERIVKYRKTILVAFIVLTLISVILGQLVRTNYEMTRYLSQDMPSVQALKLMEKEFGVPANVRIMVRDIPISEAAALKREFAAVDGVDTVTWLDDAESIHVPVEMMDPKMVDTYYRDGQALYFVYFQETDFTERTGQALRDIETILNKTPYSKAFYIFGTASSSQEVITATDSGIAQLTIIFIPIIVIILLLSTASWLEPILFLVTLGAAIVLNWGTNLLLGEVSFITQSMSIALQLAISMDYAIFLLHRFTEERVVGDGLEPAMKRAITKSFGTIIASSVTTVAGFMALLLMKFTIGTDMGLVFAKGIVLSLLTSLFLLPALALMTTKWIDKTHHRSFIPPMKKLGRGIYMLRYVSILVVLVLVVPAFMAQQSNHFIYGGSSIAEEAGTQNYRAKRSIEAAYGPFNPLMLIIPSGERVKERLLTEEIEAMPHIGSVQGIGNLVDSAIPDELVPEAVKSAFEGEAHHRIVIGLSLPEEGPETFKAVEMLKEKAERYFGDAYGLAGISASLYDVREVAARDNLVVNVAAIISVALVILLTFRSVLLPILLVISIESAVFVNMAIPYFRGESLSFVGMLIVSSIQLGATIDYAILMTSRYLERRATMDPKEAMVHAVDDAGGSILTSGLVLTVAGYAISATSQVQTVSEIGELIGRGALLSIITVFMFLPALLVLFDKWIMKRRKKEVPNAHI